MTESPSVLLERAAARIEELATAATRPQWSAVDLEDFGHQGVWWVQAETADSFSCVAELETVNPKADAAWIAAMSPAVAAPLVEMMRDAARRMRKHDLDPNGSTYQRCALAIALAILGEHTEEAT